MPPGTRIPVTPMRRYFRTPQVTVPQGSTWGDDRIAEVTRPLDTPRWRASHFAPSLAILATEYRNDQRFYPDSHIFGN